VTLTSVDGRQDPFFVAGVVGGGGKGDRDHSGINTRRVEAIVFFIDFHGQDITLKLVELFDQGAKLFIPDRDLTFGVSSNEIFFVLLEGPDIAWPTTFGLLLGLLFNVEDAISLLDIPLLDG